MMTQRRSNAILFIYLLSRTATAAPSVDELRCEALRLAKSGAQARKIDGTSFDLGVARAECKAQMESRRVPFSCYASLALEADLARKDKVEPPPLYIDEACTAAAKSADASSLDGLRNGLHIYIRSASLNCAQAVRSRIAELEYILSKKDPAALAREPE